MKKYSDWQKYVREQIDRMNDPSAEPEKNAPSRPVPSIDKDKFTIHRKTQQSEAPEQKQPAAHSKPASPSAPFWNPQPHAPVSPPAAEQQAPPPQKQTEPIKPIASPFVSVHDVWKEAEKPQKTAPAPQKAKTEPAVTSAKPVTSPRQQVTAPARTAHPTTPPKPAAKPPDPIMIEEPGLKNPKDETREEILERLINPTISLEEAAKIMGVCKATVRRYTAMGILPHYRTPGNQRRFKLNDIILFLENQKRQ